MTLFSPRGDADVRRILLLAGKQIRLSKVILIEEHDERLVLLFKIVLLRITVVHDHCSQWLVLSASDGWSLLVGANSI